MKKGLLISGLVSAAVGTGVHVYRFIVEFRRLGRAAELGILTSSSFALLQLILILSFACLGFGLLMSQKQIGRTAVVIGLLGVLFGYAGWYWYSSQILSRYLTDSFFAQYPQFIPSQTFGLLGAYWWDPMILIVTVIPAVFLIVSASTGSQSGKRMQS